MRMRHFFNGTQWPINVAPSNPSSSKRYSGSLVIAGQSQPSQNDARPFEIPKKSPPKTIQILLYLVVWLGQLGWWHSQHMEKLHRHRPQIEKISETFFHAASMGQWYSGCLDKQISQHLPTQLTWANILWKRVLFFLVEWSKWWCVWTKICVSDWHHRGCVKKKVFFLAAYDFQPWNLEIAFEGNPGSQRFKQVWQLSCIGIAWFCVMGR